MSIKCRLLLFFFCIACQLLYSQQTAGNARPNIIIILADDLGYGDLGIYGGNVPVPNLARMAQEGLRFTDFHTNGAVCSPTRASLLTGRYQQRMGIEIPLSPSDSGMAGVKARQEVTIAKYLRDAGYQTGLIGKWHLGSAPGVSPVDYGFSEFRGALQGSPDYHSKIGTNGVYDWWHNKERSPETEYNTELITRYSLEFIEQNKDNPFFLVVAENAIHFPWQTPDDTAFRKKGLKYDEVEGPLSKLGQHKPDEVKGVINIMIREIDKGVGKLMAKLRELQLDKNTIVIFFSDNGGILTYKGGYNLISSNSPFRGEKGKVYEGGHRVPAIAWWPGKIRAGAITSQVVMTMDIAPTLLQLAGITNPAVLVNKFDGRSVVPLLLQGEELKTRTVYWKHRHDCAARSGDWKLVQIGDGGVPALYDLKKDPGETTDLSTSHPALVKELFAGMEKWKREVYSGNK